MSEISRIHYKEKQSMLWLVLLVAIISIVIVGSLFSFTSELNSKSVQTVLIIGSLVLIIALLFYKLEITVTDKMAVASFGIGLVKRSTPIEKLILERAEILKTPWIWGIGYRFTPKGILLNASFSEALFIPTKHSSSFFVGSKKPKELLKALKQVQENNANNI